MAADQVISYDELRSWRDICEFLNQQWYKFAEPDDLENGCPNAQSILWLPQGRSQRQILWDNWSIQFMSWGGHPKTWYSGDRSYRRYRGWTLVSDWEFKIDLLEKIVILGRDPESLPVPWRSKILARIEERERHKQQILEQQQRIQAQYQLAYGRKTESSVALFNSRTEAGLCGWCTTPQVALMMDCPGCGKSYEADFTENFGFKAPSF